ncbi:multicopper oxidase domain-containing protein [Polyangium sp. y55x31]|uniref:multicopper oxidase family protein n=1 Tax=Polyangium sp. y55x31 TaxID=3042688 RepID=UPI0024825719|nr:multicopper oxidase domain-containing protein [Polyangium sp. y55x31]MDI1482500.1 multicopper oxidase domain-containing protein [Polyangium sp. y55x31]
MKQRNLALPIRRAGRYAFLLLSAALGGCSDEAETPAGPPEIFENPPELAPNAAGVHELRLAPSEVKIGGKRYCLRTYNGSIPGPTIRVAAGTDRKVRVNLHNDFERSDYRLVAGAANTSAVTCHDFNLTNLHAHGLHVQPNYATPAAGDSCEGSGCGPDARYHADDVLHEVPPGEMAQYRWDLDEDGTHHAGFNWYHPHIHGSTAIQVTNGAAGTLIIEGDLDEVPGIAKAKERIMVLGGVPINVESTRPLADGEACSEDTLSANDFEAAEDDSKPTLVNGKLLPHIKTSPNQVERLRIVHAGTPNELGMKLHPSEDPTCGSFDTLHSIEITQIARDGITLPKFYVSDTMWVSPGYRIEAVVKMPAEKTTLCLVGRRPSDLAGSLVAIFDVDPENGAPTETNMPEESALAAIAPPTTFMGKVDGQMMEASCESVDKIHQKIALLVPTPGEQPDPEKPAELGSCNPSDHMHGIDPDAPTCICPAPNISCRRFDDRRAWGYRSDRVMEVGTTEKWEIRAFDGHPFHIHINPYLVCANDSNKEPNFPHWRDTFWVQAEDGPRQILTNFRKFSGQFVLHCHKLNHEDMGMMELVEICPEGDTACLCQGTDAAGNCISQAGCKAEDLQCQFAKEATDAFPLPPAPNPALCGP